jgi:predicted transcriptional regulator
MLMRAGVIVKGNVQTQPKIRFTTSRERIYEYHSNLTLERQEILEAILRSVSSDVFERIVPINIKDVMHKHNISKNQFDDIIKSLQMLNLAQFVSDGGVAGFYLDKFYDNIEQIPVNFEESARRYSFALLKLDKVYEYSTTNSCKRNYLLDYFNDSSYTGNCKKCTSCNSNQIKNDVFTSTNSFLKDSIFSHLINNGGIIETTNLIKLIEVQFADTNILNLFSKKSDNFRSVVNDEIKKLSERRLIKIINNYKPTISITTEGEEFIKHLPEQFKNMARREKDKTASEIIFGKLVTLRREIAEHAGVVPRGIISDVALKKIAEVMPETEYDLKNVSGVSQLFVQKFAKLFLQELAKIKLNPKEHKVSKVAQDALKMLDQGLDFEVIKSRLFAGNLAMASNYIIEIIEAGHPLPRKSMVPDPVYSKIKACVKKFPELGPREIQTKLTIEVDSPTLKIAYSFARAELGFS